MKFFPKQLNENVVAFEKATDTHVTRVEWNAKGHEVYIVEVEMGGKDDEGIYQRVLDGPAEGERCHL